jgi:hypothetical protein
MSPFSRMPGDWQSVTALPAKAFRCGHTGCGRDVASERGWRAANAAQGGWIHICPLCNRPSFFDPGLNIQLPAPPVGREVAGLPDDVERVYHEARAAHTAGAYTSAILTCRKLLMHIAVAKGAKAGDKFIAYTQYLVDNHWAPPGSEVWVEHWRATANEANHELVLKTQDEARELLTFVEHILINVFELPASAPAPPAPQT